MQSPTTPLCRGDTYLDDGGVRVDAVRHLWVVCSDGNAAEVVVVSVTTYRSDRQDTTCPIDIGDHPFIKRTSVAYYHGAEVRSRVKIQQLLDDGSYRGRETIDPIALDRIVAGFGRSPHAPPECVELLEQQGLL